MNKEIDKIAILNNYLKDFNKIVFFGGAGVSTASGIPDFRSVDGLYNQKYQYLPEEVLSHSFFINNTNNFYKFYKDKMIYTDVLPNIVHKKIAEIETIKDVWVITQNIDSLHTLGGSKNVIELHGNIYRNYCMQCHNFFDIDVIINSIDIPNCICGGIIKPDVVLYDEILNTSVISDTIEKISNAELLIVLGTSLNVYPAAGLLRYFKGKKLVIINKEKTSFDDIAHLVINDDLVKVFQSLVIK